MTGLINTARSPLLLLGFGALLGLVMSAAEPGELNSSSIIAYGSLAAIVLLAGWIIWKRLGSDRRLGWMAVTAFALRLAVGITLGVLLPVIGYDTEPQQAGYIFFDAFQRDTQAWTLAQSGAPLYNAFNSQFFSDQYGGMLILSAGLYRLFSPDMHRPWLILLITASVSALGVVFLYKTLINRFGEKTALLASWIYVLYPEAILLGASQMRDPILIGLTTMAFYLVEHWRLLRWKSVFWLSLLMALTTLFNWLIALAVGVVLTVWWWIDYSADLADRRRRLMGWAFIALLGIAGVTIISRWLRSSAAWDMTLAVRNSGWIAALFENLPSSFQGPFIVIYGLLQPVLPAAIIDPSIPVWTIISTLLALGWYLIIPVLLYAPIAIWKSPPGVVRRLLISALVSVALWALISSFRAGGDMWDNPRYRTLFIPWIALVVAWAWNYARANRDSWLVRWYIVIGIFVAIFANWYLYRIFNAGLLIDFWTMIALIVGLSLVVLGWGVVQEIKARGNPFTKA